MYLTGKGTGEHGHVDALGPVHGVKEHVAQDVLVRMWKNLDSLRDDHIRAWLLRVTRNACIDAYRKRKTIERVIDVNSEGIAYSHAESGEVQPDAYTEGVDFRGHLRKVLADLPEPHRSIVVLREIDDLKYEEIARVLDLPLSTVKVYLHRARRMLRHQLRKRLDYVRG